MIISFVKRMKVCCIYTILLSQIPVITYVCYWSLKFTVNQHWHHDFIIITIIYHYYDYCYYYSYLKLLFSQHTLPLFDFLLDPSLVTQSHQLYQWNEYLHILIIISSLIVFVYFECFSFLILFHIRLAIVVFLVVVVVFSREIFTHKQ